MIAVDPNETREFTLPGETEPVFLIGVIDSILRAYIDDRHMKINREGKTVGLDHVGLTDKYIDFVRYGLRGWKGVKDKTGKEVEFGVEEISISGVGKRPVVTDETLKRLPLRVIVLIGLEIIKDNVVSENQAKSFS